MKSIKEQIKDGDIGNLYLLYGQEPFLVRLNSNRLRKALLTEEDEMMNLDVVTKVTDLEALKSSIETLPFFAERRVVILKESGAFAKKSGFFEPLLDLFKNLPETTTVIFEESEVDKRTKLYKAALKQGFVYEYNALDEASLVKWVVGECRRRGVMMAPADAALLASLCAADMSKILSEVEKLCAFAKEKRQITRQDVLDLVSPSIEVKIFRLMDQLCRGNSAEAYESYQALLSQNEKQERIFYMLVRQAHLLLRTSLYERPNEAVVSHDLGVRDFAAREYIREVRTYTPQGVLRFAAKMLELDTKIKTGFIGVEEALDLVLLCYGDPRVTNSPKNVTFFRN